MAIKPPDSLVISETNIDDLNLWLEAFNDYLMLTKKTNETDDYKRSLFLAVGGLELRKIVHGLTLPDNSFDNLVKGVKHYFQPITNVLVERHKFFEMKRNIDEDLSAFLVRLRRCANLCNFTDETVDTVVNTLLRDQFIRGINNKKLTEEILSKGELTLAETVKAAEGRLQAIADTEIISEATKHILTVDNVSNIVCFKCKETGHKANVCPKNKCFTCGRPGHQSNQCYKNQKCRRCNKVGHTDKVCRAKINSLLGVDNNKNNLKYVNANFFGYSLRFLVDTGASISLVSTDFIRRNNLSAHCKPCNMTSTVADGRIVPINKFVEGVIESESFNIPIKLFVYDIHMDGILGMDCIPSIGLKVGNNEGLVFSLTPSIVSKNIDIFDQPLKHSVAKNLPKFEIIKLKDSATPKACTPRTLSKRDTELVRPIIKNLLEQGVICESQSAWRSNVVVVPKKDGSPRMTINYKELNAVTDFDAYPFPHVEELLKCLSTAKCMSCLDFSNCYYQIPIVQSDQSKTAFCFDGKLYNFLRCPFGLKNAVSLCMRTMKEIFKDIPNVLVYIDDIVVYGVNEIEHDKILQLVFDKIRSVGMSLNSRKCLFKQSEIAFLGYKIKDGTISPDSSRTDPVMNFPLPTCCRSLQRFLGMITYYSRYIGNFSVLVRPLHDKLKDFQEWTQAELESFEGLKKSLADAVLVLPSTDEQLVLKTDASDRSVAAVLENSEGKPVFFCSRTLNEHERKYDVVEKEALAIYWSIIRLRSFLLGRQFTVVSDHKPLQFIFGQGKSSPKVLRWRLQLQEFSFTVEYGPGKSNVVADCLSRVNSFECGDDPLISEAEIINAQRFDNECKSLLANLKSARKPANIDNSTWRCRNELCVKNNVIYTICDKLFVPFRMRVKLLTVGHGVHHGVNQTICRIRSRFFWPNIRKSVEDYISKCRTCSLVKPKYVPPSCTPMLCKAPLEVLACDYVGPLPMSYGYKYLLVVIDVYSRYPFVFPLKSLDVFNLIKCMKKVFSVVGFPDSILTDQGSQFESGDFQAFLSSFKIEKRRTNAYHPSSNGIVERFNRTFKKSMLSYVTERGLGNHKWVDSIEHCLLDYRTTPHASTDARPVDLFFCFNVRGYLPSSENVDKLGAVDKEFRYKGRTKENFDRKSENRLFPVGSTVLVRTLGGSKFDVRGKLAIVVKQINYHTVVLRDAATLHTFRCSTARLSRVPSSSPGDKDVKKSSRDDDDGAYDLGEEEPDKQPLRRSSRSRHPPERLTYR